MHDSHKKLLSLAWKYYGDGRGRGREEVRPQTLTRPSLSRPPGENTPPDPDLDSPAGLPCLAVVVFFCKTKIDFLKTERMHSNIRTANGKRHCVKYSTSTNSKSSVYCTYVITVPGFLPSLLLLLPSAGTQWFSFSQFPNILYNTSANKVSITAPYHD